jgi:hypothetical protein
MNLMGEVVPNMLDSFLFCQKSRWSFNRRGTSAGCAAQLPAISCLQLSKGRLHLRPFRTASSCLCGCPPPPPSCIIYVAVWGSALLGKVSLNRTNTQGRVSVVALLMVESLATLALQRAFRCCVPLHRDPQVTGFGQRRRPLNC